MKKNQYISSLDNLIIYWINMDKSIKRRKYMRKVLQDPVFKGIPKERISAFDPESQNVMDKLIISKKSPHMTPSSYGCLISHLDTIHTFSKSEYDFALFFEDDLSLDEYKPFWNKPLDEIVRGSPPDWEIIQLGFGLNDQNPSGLPQMEYTPMSIGNYWQTVSYLISKAGAKRFIKEYYLDGKYRLYNNICQEADNFIFHVLRTYTYQFPLFTNNTGLNSSIYDDKQKKMYSKFSKELLREHFFINKKNNNKTHKKCRKNENIAKKKVNWRATRCINGKRKLGFIKTIQND